MTQDELIDFGDLKVGDYIHGLDGPVQVQKVYEEHIPERMFRLEFEGGEEIEASGNHLWYVESELDKYFINERIKNSEKLLSTLTAESKVDLLELAFYSNGNIVPETEIYDMLAICGGVDENNTYNSKMAILFTRIADSIGPIMEETTQLQDLGSEEIASKKTSKLYDARRFAQQILAYSSERYRLRWPVIVGKVVTTLEILEVYKEFDVDLPTISKL